MKKYKKDDSLIPELIVLSNESEINGFSLVAFGTSNDKLISRFSELFSLYVAKDVYLCSISWKEILKNDKCTRVFYKVKNEEVQQLLSNIEKFVSGAFFKNVYDNELPNIGEAITFWDNETNRLVSGVVSEIETVKRTCKNSIEQLKDAVIYAIVNHDCGHTYIRTTRTWDNKPITKKNN